MPSDALASKARYNPNKADAAKPRQGHHAAGLTGKLLMELLGARYAAEAENAIAASAHVLAVNRPTRDALRKTATAEH